MSHTAHGFDSRPSRYNVHHSYHTRYRSQSATPAVVSRIERPLFSSTVTSSPSAVERHPRPRYVPPFSIQSHQKNTIVIDGPLEQGPNSGTASARGKINHSNNTQKNANHNKNNNRKLINNNNINNINDNIRTKNNNSNSNRRKVTSMLNLNMPLHPSEQRHQRKSLFRMYFDRGDLPIKMEYLCGGDKIAWTVDIDKLDYSLYLPLFFDGLCETNHPYKTYARQGVSDLLIAGGEKIHPVIPQLILPLKNALSTRNLEVICTTLKIIQQLVMSSDMVGPALVPFYRQLLPMFNAYKVKNVNCGDNIDYAQKNNMNLGDLIDETLQVLELHGGEDAFINIKYMVPTYESCYLN